MPDSRKRNSDLLFFSTHLWGERGAIQNPQTQKEKLNLTLDFMKTERSMKPKTFEQEKIRIAKNIVEKFSFFSTGVRVLLLLQRHKEGGETNNSKLRKIVTKNEQEYYDAVLSLVSDKMDSELPLRIYASSNERDFDKAIRKFKFEQLEADYYSEEQRNNFYLDIKNRFIGCLMQPQQRATSFFLFDCDETEEQKDVLGQLLQLIPNEHIVFQYKTKNGWHVITNPFNYTKISFPPNIELKKDGLLLLDY